MKSSACLLLCLFPALACATSIEPGAPSPLQCVECHPQFRHSNIDLDELAARECTECHEQPDLKPAFNRIADHWDALAEKDLPRFDEEVDLAPGMRYPLRYRGTRLGAGANDMLPIPAGSFIMGSDHRLPDEGPAHEVEVDDFWIDRFEVTNLQYRAFMRATAHRSPLNFRNRTYPPGTADHPVTYVTWHDASAYCQWAGKRLPTDAEWEKAARGPENFDYPWGRDFELHRSNNPQRWGALKQPGSTTPVGAFEAGKSGYGLYDMSGNVWEWTASWYRAYPGNQRPTENYGEIYKTLKGGSWWDCSFYACGISAPSYNRGFFLRNSKNKSLGFRCAKNP